MKISQSLRRIYSGGLACAFLAAVIGVALERARFGSSEADAFSSVEASVRSEVAAVTTSLNEIASSVAREPGLLDAAAADPAGARALFDLADVSLQGRPPGVFAVTAYRASGSGTPLAWSGRPSEIPLERLSESEVFFVESGPLGLRLVYVSPVTDASTGHRVGMIAAERVLSASRGIRAASAEAALTIPTIVPVTVRPHDSSVTGEGHTFAIQSPTGAPLLDARVTSAALESAHARWRNNVTAVALVLLALTLLVSIAPLLWWRDTLAKPGDQASVLGIVLALLLAARALLWLAPVPDWTEQIFRAETLGVPLGALLQSPVDFLLTMLLLAAVVALGFELAGRLRHHIRRRQSAPGTNRDWALCAASQMAAGALVALSIVGYEVILRNAISAASVDALHFSLHPWDESATARVAFAIAVLLTQAVVFWTGVLVLQLMSLPWRIPRTGATAAAAFLLQAMPIALIAAFPRVIGAAPSTVPQWPTAVAGFSCLVLAWAIGWVRPRYRHASQALRLAAGALVLISARIRPVSVDPAFCGSRIAQIDRRTLRPAGSTAAGATPAKAVRRSSTDRSRRVAHAHRLFFLSFLSFLFFVATVAGRGGASAVVPDQHGDRAARGVD